MHKTTIGCKNLKGGKREGLCTSRFKSLKVSFLNTKLKYSKKSELHLKFSRVRYFSTPLNPLLYIPIGQQYIKVNLIAEKIPIRKVIPLLATQKFSSRNNGKKICYLLPKNLIAEIMKKKINKKICYLLPNNLIGEKIAKEKFH